MPRPVTLTLSAICAGLVVLLVVLFSKRGERPIAAQPDEPAPLIPQGSPNVVDGSAVARPSVAAVRRPTPPAPVQPDAHEPANEASLLQQLHDLAGSNPELSLKLAREAVKRFPDSANAPEFEWNVVKALFNMRRLDEAEAEARVMVAKYPGDYFTGDVEHHLLHHPPNPSDLPQ